MGNRKMDSTSFCGALLFDVIEKNPNGRRATRAARCIEPIISITYCVAVRTMMPIRRSGVATIAALWGILGASATPATRADSLTVDSEKSQVSVRQRADVFVRALTRNPGFSDSESLVRWNVPICLFAAGLPEEDLNTVSARLTQIISAAGALLAREPCQPNFSVIVTDDPDRVLEAWSARNKQLFGDATPSQVRRFLDSSGTRPIRVWRNIDRGRTAGTRLGHFVPSNNNAESSSFVRNSVLGFFSVFAIVDTNLASHASLDQQTDYIAMTGLSNVDLDADIGSAPSILRLFVTSATPPTGLSSWDAAFLKALYQSDQTSRTQRHDIAERVTNEISHSK